MKRNHILPIIFFLCLGVACNSNSENNSTSPFENVENQSTRPEHDMNRSTKPVKGSLSDGKQSDTENKFWDNKKVFFRDMVGGTSALTYEAIKGQRHFSNTYIFVYTTSEDMVGTAEYDKVAEIFDGTKLDDRVFIWVHLDQDRKVKEIKKLISENIREALDQSPLTL